MCTQVRNFDQLSKWGFLLAPWDIPRCAFNYVSYFFLMKAHVCILIKLSEVLEVLEMHAQNGLDFLVTWK